LTEALTTAKSYKDAHDKIKAIKEVKTFPNWVLFGLCPDSGAEFECNRTTLEFSLFIWISPGIQFGNHC